MSILFLLIWFLSIPVMIFFIVKMVLSKVKKDEGKEKKYKKFSLISLGVSVLSLFIFAGTVDTDEEADKGEPESVAVTSQDKKKEEPKLTEEQKTELAKKNEEEKVAAELKTKKDAETKAKVEAENKVKAEAAKKATASAEKNYYINEVVPQMEGVMGVYDRIWSEIWKPTFEGLSNGSVDIYTAYENMKSVEHRYTALGTQISNINGDKLSKENKKLLEEFKSELRDASSLRRSSGNEAKKLIDKGTFSPSEIDKVMTTVGYSDGPMMNAVICKTTLDMNFGVLKE